MTAPKDREGLITLIEQALDAGLDPLDIIEAAGLRVVPVEATREMCEAIYESMQTTPAREGWPFRAERWIKAAVAASPYAPPPEDPA